MSETKLPLTIALVDIGTNTLKYSVKRVGEDLSARVIDSWAETVRIGAGLQATGRLDEERIRLALRSLSASAERARARGATEFVGVGTEAIRRASNGQDLIDGIEDWKIRIISGDEEAALAYRGLRPFLATSGTTMIADVGGGSTELISVEAGEVVRSVSLAMGSTVLADQYFEHEPPLETEVDAVEAAAIEVVRREVGVGAAPDVLILSGGNGTFLRDLSVSLGFEGILNLKTIESLLSKLTVLQTAEVAERLRISLERAKVFPAGVAIALAIVRLVKPGRIEARPSGIRNGLLLDWLDVRFPGVVFVIRDEGEQAD